MQKIIKQQEDALVETLKEQNEIQSIKSVKDYNKQIENILMNWIISSSFLHES